MKRPARISFLAVLVVLFSVAIVADAPEIRTLKNAKFTRIEAPGASITEVRGLNNLGEIVGAWDGGGFVFSGGAYTSIEVPGAVVTAATDINDAGDIVGSYTEPGSPGQMFGDTHGFLLTADGQLTTITFPGQQVTQVWGINNHGQIVGSYTEVEGDEIVGVHSFMLDNGVFTLVDFPVPTPRASIFVTFATGINDAGDIVGGYNEDDIFQTRRGFLLRNGEYTTINVPTSDYTEVFDINNAGEMVGEFQSGQIYGFLFSPKRGFYRLVSTHPKQEFRSPPAPFAINDLNQFAGDGVTVDGLRGFVATLPPGW